MAIFLKKISSREPSLHAADVDVALNVLCKNDEKLEQIVLGREFHISLGRTVPIRVHQIDSMVSMLRQKLQTQQRSVCALRLVNCEMKHHIFCRFPFSFSSLSITSLVVKQLLD